MLLDRITRFIVTLFGPALTSVFSELGFDAAFREVLPDEQCSVGFIRWSVNVETSFGVKGTWVIRM